MSTLCNILLRNLRRVRTLQSGISISKYVRNLYLVSVLMCVEAATKMKKKEGKKRKWRTRSRARTHAHLLVLCFLLRLSGWQLTLVCRTTNDSRVSRMATSVNTRHECSVQFHSIEFSHSIGSNIFQRHLILSSEMVRIILSNVLFITAENTEQIIPFYVQHFQDDEEEKNPTHCPPCTISSNGCVNVRNVMFFHANQCLDQTSEKKNRFPFTLVRLCTIRFPNDLMRLNNNT